MEQQAALFDAPFFAWFVRTVVAPRAPLFLNLATDWGLDQLWCRAARSFLAASNGTATTSGSGSADGAVAVGTGVAAGGRDSGAASLFNASDGASGSGLHVCAIIVASAVTHLQNVSEAGVGPKHARAAMRVWRYNFGGFLAKKALSAEFPHWRRPVPAGAGGTDGDGSSSVGSNVVSAVKETKESWMAGGFGFVGGCPVP